MVDAVEIGDRLRFLVRSLRWLLYAQFFDVELVIIGTTLKLISLFIRVVPREVSHGDLVILHESILLALKLETCVSR